MSEPGLYPSGLAPQRTALAWRRTLIGLLIGSLVSQRVLAPAVGAWSFAVAIPALVLTATIWLLSERRSRRFDAAAISADPVPGAGLLLLLAAAVTTAAVIGLFCLSASFCSAESM